MKGGLGLPSTGDLFEQGKEGRSPWGAGHNKIQLAYYDNGCITIHHTFTQRNVKIKGYKKERYNMLYEPSSRYFLFIYEITADGNLYQSRYMFRKQMFAGQIRTKVL